MFSHARLSLIVPLVLMTTVVRADADDNFEEQTTFFALPTFVDRSQVQYEYMYLMGNAFIKHQPHMDDFWFDASVAPTYMQNYNRDRLGQYFSFNCRSNGFTVGDITKGDSDFGAQLLGLQPATNFLETGTQNEILFFEPRIRSFVAQVNLHFGLEPIADGLFLDIRVPVVWTKWDPRLQAQTEKGQPFVEAFTGVEQEVEIDGMDNTILSWGFGKMACPTRDSESGVGDVLIDLGWNFHRRQDSYTQLRLRGIFPAGNEPNNQWIFEPRLGNNRYALGAGLQAMSLVWEKGTDDKIYLYGDVNGSHLFARRELRSFDFRQNGPGSRYLLLKEFDGDEFTGRFHRAVDKTTVNAESRFLWQLEATLMAELHHEHWIIDFGYNIYAREHEELDFCGAIQRDTYGIASGLNADDVTESRTTLSQSFEPDEELIFISAADLDISRSQIPRFVQHTLFFDATHVWDNHEYPAYVGIGGSISIGAENQATDQWSVWIKGGFLWY